MKVGKQSFRTIWPDPRCKFVHIIDQTQLPFAFNILQVHSLEQMVQAIKTMQVRGAPLIGAAKGLFDMPELTQMNQAIALHVFDVRQIGCDIRVRAKPHYA